MSEREERRLEKRFKDGKWYVREWRPGEWREATPEEVEGIPETRRKAEELLHEFSRRTQEASRVLGDLAVIVSRFFETLGEAMKVGEKRKTRPEPAG